MKISPEYLIERNRNKIFTRRWKLLALLSLFLLFIFAAKFLLPSNVDKRLVGSSGKMYIASISINDVITNDPKRETKLKEISDDNDIQALIININSPGGTVVGSEVLYNSLRKISKRIPVVAVLGSLATSGGYLAALGADYIISHNGTITGSIGVILQSAEITELAEKVGIRFNNFKSGILKATPNYAEKVTPEVQSAIMDSINDVYTYFIELTAERRNLDIETVRKIADGRIYSARAALRLKLIDKIGNSDDAIKWLQVERKISDALQVKEVKFYEINPILEKVLDEVNGKLSSFFSYNLIKGFYM